MASNKISFRSAIQALSQICDAQYPDVTQLIEDALLELISSMAPDRDLLRQVIYSKNASLLDELLTRHGAEFYQEAQKSPPQAEQAQIKSTHYINALRGIGNAIAELPASSSSVKASLRSAFIRLMADIEEPDQVFRIAFGARDNNLLRAVFKNWPDANWNQIHSRANSTKIGTLIHEQDYDLLLTCRDAGIMMSNNMHLLIQTSLKLDDPEPIRLLREEFGHTGLIWKQNDFNFSIIQCGHNLAPLIWEELQIHLQDFSSRAIQSFIAFRGGLNELKPLAALLCSGYDITPLYRPFLKYMHPHLASLVLSTGSSHGQVFLKTLEPDPISVIGRSPSDSFFGCLPTQVVQIASRYRFTFGEDASTS